jgi:glycosyltransferase involved in cell wall biosynthesis
LLLNNDAQLLPGTLSSALRTIRGAPDIGAVGGKVILLDGRLQEAGSIIWRDGSCLGYGRGDDPLSSVYMFQRDVDYCSGAFLLTPRRVWEELGGFDEIYRPAYYEETDYCFRLWRKGLRVVYDPGAVILHYEFGSTTSTQTAIDLQQAHQSIFEQRHRASLRTHYDADVNSILVARMKRRDTGRVLFLDDRVPHPSLGSGFPRAQAMLLTLLKQGFFVTFYPLTYFNEDWPAVYADMPRELEVIRDFGPALLEAFLRSRPRYYDWIVVSRPHNMKTLQQIILNYPEWFETATVIYDAEALFVYREVRRRQLSGQPLTSEETDQLLKEEIALASSAHCVIAVSEREREMFNRYGIERTHVVGHAIAPTPTPKSFAERNGFLFVGAIHEEVSPNGDSVIWFIEEILPRIEAALGPVTFTLAGVNNSERIRQLAVTNPGVRILGRVDNLNRIYDAARVFVAPTRYGAGIPHKVHEAASCGVPIVGTPLLAEQLGWTDGREFAVGDGAEAFAKKCIDLHTNEALWRRMREYSLEVIRTECSLERFEDLLKQVIAGRVRFADVGMDR